MTSTSDISAFFPFSYIRPGQRELVDDTLSVVQQGHSLVAHAPTGIGKTAGVLAPALQYAIQEDKTVIFLTPRHSQHNIALETLQRMRQKTGQQFAGCNIIGKKWLCNVESVENMDSRDFLEYCRAVRKDDRCPFYNNTFTQKDKQLQSKAAQHIQQLSGNINTAQEVKRQTTQFCPYEIVMQLLRHAKVIIADYFHIFHPKVRQSVFDRAELQLEDCIIVVDEAHNLPDRVRSLLSSQLTEYGMQQAITECNAFGFYELEETLRQVNRELRELMQQLLSDKEKGYERFVEKQDIIKIIEQWDDFEEFVLDVEMVADEVREQKKRSFAGGLAEFLRTWYHGEDGYARVMQQRKKQQRTEYRLLLRCLNPAFYSADVLNDSHASILMSGTLTPLEMYRDLLGISSDMAQLRSYQSSFNADHRQDIVVNTVTTRYAKRSDDEFQKLGWYISQCCQAIPGNVGVFFPSYKMRDAILNHVSLAKKPIYEKQGDRNTNMQRLQELEAHKEHGSVLFGVFRGSFDQGIDYPGDIMNGVILVGLPLERPDLETQALISYYDVLFDRGWDYGYIYPAMNLATQAAGRCIRSEEDKAVVVYLDERYLWSNYRKGLPVEQSLTVSKAPWLEIEEFFTDPSQ